MLAAASNHIAIGSAHGSGKIGRSDSPAPTRTARTWLASSARKQGRSGPLVFVTVRTEVSQDGQVVITEEQDLVYREPGADNPARSGPSVTAAGRDRAVTVDPVLLFRFSALTYNAHRIHYDREFARGEGYPGPTATRSGCRAATPRTA